MAARIANRAGSKNVAEPWALESVLLDVIEAPGADRFVCQFARRGVEIDAAHGRADEFDNVRRRVELVWSHISCGFAMRGRPALRRAKPFWCAWVDSGCHRSFAVHTFLYWQHSSIILKKGRTLFQTNENFSFYDDFFNVLALVFILEAVIN